MTDCAKTNAHVLEVMQIRHARISWRMQHSTAQLMQGRAGQGRGLTSTTNTQMP